jgi:hypothetical protein
LGADGQEMSVLLPEFFGGAHGFCNLYFKSAMVALAREDLDPLKPHLKPVPLPRKQILSKPDTSIDHVHFPQEGMVSLVQPLENGTTIGVGMIGNEGLVGVPVLLCADTSPLKRAMRRSRPASVIVRGQRCWHLIALRKNALAAATSPLGLSLKSTVRPARSTARYR